MVYIGAAVIGLLLGLMGSGGSILTVPVLLYLVGHSEKVVFAESMAIVGIISAVAVIPYAWRRTVCWRTVLWFGIPGVMGTYGGVAIALQVDPRWQLITFALVLAVAAWLMLRGGAAPSPESPVTTNDKANFSTQSAGKTLQVVTEGLVVGAITGFVGVGGGFLIVPALVLLGGLRMQQAVATSLVVIVLKSLIGFFKYQHGLAETGLSVSWETIGMFSVIGICGSFLGRAIGQRMPQEKLRLAFGIFLILMGVFVLYQELSKLAR
ncbi:MAG: sulfite exporter TauE/SafE family protein [Planctomycetaceae bacterium]|nr:sulfite exporter TauE/SafE family protein [Planctomycetaceae bacterium]